MQPHEVRLRVLHDHEALREQLDELEELVRDVESGDGERALSLRMHAVEVLRALETHMHWEDCYLVPVLRDSDAWGPERVKRFDADHREQREVLRHVLNVLADSGRPPSLIARGVRDLVFLLRADMEEEESVFLDPRVVRDDVVGIDVETD